MKRLAEDNQRLESKLELLQSSLEKTLETVARLEAENQELKQSRT